MSARDFQPGHVYLVGTGPGDPDLLTVKALRLMQQCDVVLHDNLVTPAIMALVRPEARRIYVGKRRSDHALPQEEISALLARLARDGLRVLRLKAGDPFVFGRGGEEIEVLAREGIAFDVVPGITAALGVAAYSGIPLTHRDCAQACVLVTGNRSDGTLDLDWEALARPHQTLAIYMGFQNLPEICAQLVAHGLAATTPAAIVQQGATPKQRVVSGDLATLPGLAAAAELHPPTLIIGGEVVRLRQRLAWYEEARLEAALLAAE